MSIIVYTEATCDRCGAVNNREGAEGSIPPVEWSQLHLSIRHEGSGWENHSRYQYILCDKCAAETLHFLDEEAHGR